MVILDITTTTGGTTDPPPGVYIRDRGSSATITGTPYSGYVFDHWTVNGVERTENPISLVLTEDPTSVTAYFRMKPPQGQGVLEVHVYEDGYEVPTEVKISGENLPEGERTEISPVLLGLDPGTYTVAATHYNDYRTITITAGETTRVDFHETAPPAPTKAEIAISAYFDSTNIVASYEVRDYYTNVQVASGTTPATVKVDPGTYKVLCTYQGKTQSSVIGRLEAGQVGIVDFYFGVPQYGRIEAHFYDGNGEVAWPERDGDVYWLLYTKGGINLGKFYAGTGVDVVPDAYTVEAYYYGRKQTREASVKAGETAKLEFEFRRLTIIAAEGGTTDPAPGTYICDKGSSVTVTATPSPGYVFDHWTLDGSTHAQNPITVVADEDVTLTAYFRKTGPPPPPPPVKKPFPLFPIPIGLGAAVVILARKG